MSETTTMAPMAARAADDFTPIADHGLLADCNSAALLTRDGSIDWLCLPRYDSPAIMARILDPEGGHWSIRPTGDYTAERRYLPGTLVIETTFTTDTGSVRLLDAMAFAPGQRGHELGFDAPHELLRAIDGREGRGGARARARRPPGVRLDQAADPARGRRRPHLRLWAHRRVVRGSARGRRPGRHARVVHGLGGRARSGSRCAGQPPSRRRRRPPRPPPRSATGSRTRPRPGAPGRRSTTSTRGPAGSSCG